MQQNESECHAEQKLFAVFKVKVTARALMIKIWLWLQCGRPASGSGLGSFSLLRFDVDWQHLAYVSKTTRADTKHTDRLTDDTWSTRLLKQDEDGVSSSPLLFLASGRKLCPHYTDTCPLHFKTNTKLLWLQPGAAKAQTTKLSALHLFSSLNLPLSYTVLPPCQSVPLFFAETPFKSPRNYSVMWH